MSKPGCSPAAAFGLNAKYLALKHKDNKPMNLPVAFEMMMMMR